MRLHTDTLTAHQVYQAVTGIDGVAVELTTYGSRVRDHAFDVHLMADERKGRRKINTGNYGAGYDYAATWDEWGIFFGHLFALDPDMTCRSYDGAEDYHWQTGERFRPTDGNRFRIEDFTPHDQHRWELDPGEPRPVGSPSHGTWVHRCSKCGAVKRYRARARQTTS